MVNHIQIQSHLLSKLVNLKIRELQNKASIFNLISRIIKIQNEDLIGNTLFSKHNVFSLLLKLIKVNYILSF